LRDAWLRFFDPDRQQVRVLGDPGCEMIGAIQEPRVAARGREQHQRSDGSLGRRRLHKRPTTSSWFVV